MKPEDHYRISGVIAFAEAIMVLRDPYEDGHGRRVAALAERLARELKYPESYVELLSYAGRLHDIGKILIAENILNKPRLSESEMNMVHSHAMLGERVIIKLRINEFIRDAVGQSHENWNGTGYFRGLQRDEISSQACILRITDTYDALTNERPYRRGCSSSVALDIMTEESGSSFDPTVFNVFKRIMLDSNG